MDKRILITGATGMLGKDIFKEFVTCYPSAEIYTTSRTSFSESNNHYKIDIKDIDQLNNLLRDVEPEIIIHCAAITDVTFCEENPKEAEKIHIKATEVLSSYDSVDKLIYISTDSVFDGQRGGYKETEATNPLNTYARTKRDGELVTMEKASSPYVLRCNLMGFKNPLGNSLFEWGYNELKQGNSIYGFSNVYFNPLYTKTLAGMITKFLTKDTDSGYYHFGSKPSISKNDFLHQVAKRLNLNKNHIEPFEVSNEGRIFPRPLNTYLDCTKLYQTGVQIPSLYDCIDEMISDFKKKI